MAEAATYHWKSSGCDLPKAMDTICPDGDNILETIFSFQPEQVEVFVNTEGARGEDVAIRYCPEDGGFELTVTHRDGHPRTQVRREVRRLYSFQRPLRWEQAKATLTPEGIFHLVVPGPVIPHQYPMDSCF